MTLQYLLDLCELFTNDATLQQEVRLAYEQPQQYLQQFKNKLEERGIEEPIETLAWIALVDGLQRRDLLQELDWKDDPEDAIAVVEDLTQEHQNQQKIHNTLSKLEPLLNDDIEEFLPTINFVLKQYDIKLVWLDIDSDSYPLTLLPFKELANAKELANKVGFGMIKN